MASSKYLGQGVILRMLVGLLVCVTAHANQDKALRLVEIAVPTHDAVYDLRHYEIDILGADIGCVRALACDAAIRSLEWSGFRVEVLIPDYFAYKRELHARGFYRTYAQVGAALDSFAATYPDQCRLDTIGYSVDGRAIWAMRVTDNPMVEECETEIWLGANMHGDEMIGTEVTLYYLRYLLTHYGSNAQVQDLVNNREIWILPILNPDGHVNDWRYNSNGVDLNRDYGFMWDGEGSSPGPSSQVENRTVMAHLIENNISMSFNYHSAAYYVNYLFDYHPADPPDSQHIITLSQVYADSAGLYAINGYDWYQITGSLQDYTFGTGGALAWTIETDEPSGSSAIDQICYENRNALMDICDRAGWGIEGTVRDSLTSSPRYARVEITSPERVCVYSDPGLGDFHKMAQAGTYSIRITANGYQPKILTDVTVPASGSVNVGTVDLARDSTWLYAFRPILCRYSDHAPDNKTQPRHALGAPDNVFFSLGQGGYVVLDMGEATPITNNDGNDFVVYEGSDASGNEGYTVHATNDWTGSWSSCGTGSGTDSFDLSAAGLSQARYVRVTDDNSASSGQYAGFDLDAVGFFTSLTGVSSEGARPRAFLDVFPSVFSTSVAIALSPSRTGRARLVVFDATGRVLKDLTRSVSAGPGMITRIAWDGRDEAGARLPAGIYFIRFTDGSQTLIRKTIKLD